MAISLGDAVLRLLVDDAQLQAGMNSVQNTVGQKLTQASTVAGAAMTAAGATITGALGAAVTSAVSYGSSIVDAAAKTQVSTESFSELQHAAEQSGTSAEKLQMGLINIVKALGASEVETTEQTAAFQTLGISAESLAATNPANIFDLIGTSANAAVMGSDANIAAFQALGLSVSDLQTMAPEQIFSLLSEQMNTASVSTSAQGEAFAKLGLSVESFKGLAPDQIFMILAEAISGVQDPILQSQLAMDVFGAKCGPELLPLLKEGQSGIQALREEAKELGLSLSGEQAGQLESFGDSWENISKSLQGVAIQIGIALMPVLQSMADSIIPIISSITQWAQANPELTQTLIVAAGAIGAVMTVLGPLLIVLPGVAAAAAAMGVGITAGFGIFLAIPAIIAAVVAAGYLLWSNWDTVTNALGDLWGWLADTANWAWEGIKSIFNDGLSFIMSVWEKIQPIMEFLMNPIGESIQIASDIASGNLDIPGFASGGIAPGGLALVGERGPELVNLPTGSRVFNNSDTERMIGSSNTTYAPTITVNVSNANNLNADELARRIGIQVDKAMRK